MDSPYSPKRKQRKSEQPSKLVKRSSKAFRSSKSMFWSPRPSGGPLKSKSQPLSLQQRSGLRKEPVSMDLPRSSSNKFFRSYGPRRPPKPMPPSLGKSALHKTVSTIKLLRQRKRHSVLRKRKKVLSRRRGRKC